MAIAQTLTIIGIAAILVFVMLDDIRHHRIRNEVVAALATLCVPTVVMEAGHKEFLEHLLFAVAMFIVFLLLYHFRTLGGGDVKLLTIAFLYLGIQKSFLFSVLMLVIGVTYGLCAKAGILPSRAVLGRIRIAFGPTIALAWIATDLIYRLVL